MIFALIGPSGSGKGKFAEIFKEFSIEKSVSCTTRKIREGEKEGVNYYFLKGNEPDFKERMLSSPAYDSHRGVFYFTEKEEFLKRDNVYCEMSRKGIHDLKRVFGEDNVVSIYIYCNPEDCKDRIENRNGIEYAEMRMNCNYEEESFSDIDNADYVICNNNKNSFIKNSEIFRTIIKMEMDKK